MEFKTFLLVFCSCAVFRLQTVSGFPQSSESDETESSDDDVQQVVQQEHSHSEDLRQFQQNINRVDENNIFQIQPDPLDANDTCLEKRETGPCKAYFPRYFLNKESGKCERFTYGGCGGSENNFKSLVACEKRCARHLRSTKTNNNNGDDPNVICELPPVESGGLSCSSAIPKWTFNTQEMKCVRFMYGGCRGTKNNFENKYACERVCADYRKKPAGGTRDGRGSSVNDIENLNQNHETTCGLKMDSGPCYGMMRRYFYSKQKNRCEKFIFGGCGGNDNNFQTAEECLRTCGGDTPSDDDACSLIECPWNLYSHYQTLGCKPIYDGQACCPTRYDCPDANITLARTWAAPTCRYQGKSYAVGEAVPDASIESSCRAACTCYGFGGKPRINCANIECRENLEALPIDKENCTLLYKKGRCCAYDYYCPNDTLTQQPEEIKKGGIHQHALPIVPLEKCHYEGTEFVVGQRFYPKNGQCLICTCLKGFNGTLSEEYCRKIDCGIEIYYSSQLERGCVPVHLKDKDGQDSCCPIGWQCPDENIHALSSEQIQTPSVRSLNQYPGAGHENHILRITNKNVIVVTLNSTVCDLLPETGPCRAHRPRFYYNNDTHVCEPFIYGGCKGNGNNFIKESDCEEVCQNNTEILNEPIRKSPFARAGDTGFIQPKIFHLTEVDPCTLPKKSGHCKAYFPRYFFSVEDNTCKYFVFGGCGGNQNNFISMESCEATCQNKVPIESLRMSENYAAEMNRSGAVIFNDNDQQNGQPRRKVTDITKRTENNSDENDDDEDEDTSDEIDPAVVCQMKPVTGPCRAHRQRYYYDPEVKYCKRFTYGGCGGNANNFEKLGECDYRCAPNKGRGLPGPAVYPKWRSSNVPVTPAPEETIDQVVTSSESQSKTDVCKLPAKVGTCYGNIPSVYYDALTNTCQNFTYGGCFGNANRFTSMDECEKNCRIPIMAEVAAANPTLARAGPPNQQWSVSIGGTGDGGNGGIISIPNSHVVLSNQNRLEEEKAACSLDPSPGFCKGQFMRYFWHKDTSRCIPFIYTGCRGNGNNFISESDCISTCGIEPTLEQVVGRGALMCSFGNETLPLGATLGSSDQDQTIETTTEPPCGVAMCTCMTPPSLTCIQTSCPVETRTDIFCPTPSCGPHCKPAVRPDNGCPTCDCESGRREWDVELVKQPEFTVVRKGVKS